MVGNRYHMQEKSIQIETASLYNFGKAKKVKVDILISSEAQK